MSKPSKPAIIVILFAASTELAQRVARISGGQIHKRGQDFSNTPDHCRALFQSCQPIIFIGASGIIIRALAPVINDKWSEPPVIAISDCGKSVIPLLGGHRGANDIARQIATALSTRAAITTAGDIHLGIALDAPPEGWNLENPEDAGKAMAALISGARAKFSGFADWLQPLKAHAEITPSANPDDPIILTIEGSAPLIYRRKDRVLGVGCARGCDPDELIALVAQTLAEAGESAYALHSVHSIDLKTDEAAIHALAAHFAIPARFHTAKQLASETPNLMTPSETVFAETGCYGVAEGAALVAGGDQARLIIAKTKSTHATCALARGCNGALGHARGRASIVGIGPGQSLWRTPEATRHIAEADELVGYGFYIDLLGPEALEKPRKNFGLSEEEARCRYALEAAGRGKKIALICSGDGGIYAMGALVMELFARPQDKGGVSPAARRAEIIHIPGISALQAASARAGALLGHDFCAISLSDLLTQRATILKRLKAAAEGDFVIALYNPVSARRRTLLNEAREILLKHRRSDTPVLLASNLGRSQEQLITRNLRDLCVDGVDMMTIVIIGSSTTTRARGGDKSAGVGGEWLFTPRGYGRKIDGEIEK